jgi:pimeloyl-ACP methyl ester carboxylesterase
MLTCVRQYLQQGLCLTYLLCVSGTLSFSASAQTRSVPAPGESIFRVFVRTAPSGLITSTLAQEDNQWILRATNQITAPLDLQTQLFEMTYDSEWRPQHLRISGTRNRELFNIESTFGGDIVTNEVQIGSEATTTEERIDAASIVLPNFFFAAYEALAIRLTMLQPGNQVPIYVAPRGYITARLNSVNTLQLDTADGNLLAKVYHITFDNPNDPISAEVWVDERSRLMRVTLPSASIDVARQDILAVSTRVTSPPHPGDETIRVGAAGFSLAGTLTKPVDVPAPANGRWPTILLVPDSVSSDRDVTFSGIPIFRQLSDALVENGFMVMRFDKRGVGQSGGRPESATLEDYADDVRELVRYLERRPDVDRERIILVGYSDGGWVSLVAARRENKIKAVALIATAGISGDELVLEQQATLLTSTGNSDIERQENIDLQQRVNRAVLNEGSWEGISEAVRAQANTPWFRSMLAFEPESTIERVRQPLLILQGELDQQTLPYHAERLQNIATRRTRAGATVEASTLPGIDHHLTTSANGNNSEYLSFSSRGISSTVPTELVRWIQRTLPE